MIQKQLPDVAHFETFMQVADSSSFTLAAKKLHKTKAAISTAIKVLENEIGAPLFIRSTRKVILTEDGKLLLAQCERLKNELDITRNLIHKFHQQPKGKLTINCNAQLSKKYLLPTIETYLKNYPEVKIEVLIEEKMFDLKNESIDVLVGVNWPAPDDIIARKIGETRYVLCASPEYFKKNEKPKKISDLEKQKIIIHSGRNPDYPVISLKNKNPQPKISAYLSANNIEFMKNCVLTGLGIAQFHDYVVEDELKQGQLIEILPELFNQNEPLYLYYLKHRHVQPKIRKLVDLLVDLYKSHPSI